jgi:hypothetical protein
MASLATTASYKKKIFNALKHGILSQQSIVHTDDYEEDVQH